MQNKLLNMYLTTRRCRAMKVQHFLAASGLEKIWFPSKKKKKQQMIVERFSSCRADSDLTRFGEESASSTRWWVCDEATWLGMDGWTDVFFLRAKTKKTHCQPVPRLKAFFSFSPSSSIYHNFCQTANHMFSSFPKNKKSHRIAASLTAQPATGSTQTLAHVHIHAIKKPHKSASIPIPLWLYVLVWGGPYRHPVARLSVLELILHHPGRREQLSTRLLEQEN